MNLCVYVGVSCLEEMVRKESSFIQRLEELLPLYCLSKADNVLPNGSALTKHKREKYLRKLTL